MTKSEHERDSDGHCLACLRHGEKLALVERAQKTQDATERETLLERIRNLS